MAEEDFGYRDISELKKELEVMKGKKDISAEELYDAVQKLADAMTGMLEVFGAAAEQMKLEEQGYEANAKKHEIILSKLDKIIDQNKTIAEGMVAIVDMVKEKIIAPAKEKEETFFKPRAEPRPLFKPEWQPKPIFAPQPQPQMSPMQLTPPMPTPQMAPSMTMPEFGMPPMQPAQDLDFPDLDLGLEEEPKKKGLFGMFKK